jgi:hypothetical protein
VIRYYRILSAMFLLLSVFSAEGLAQDNWDNQLFVGNKVSWGSGQWKYSGELQFRVKDNMSTLDNWFIEGVASYLPSEHWELAPDFRFSVKSNSQEYRPGFGVLYKILSSKLQFVNQLKYQADFSSNGTFGHGLREVIFLNFIVTEKYIPFIAVGAFYRWRKDFSDFEFVRIGGGLNIRFDPLHILSVSYFVGALNHGDRWTFSGIPLLQFSINIRSDWMYVPAKIINF